MLDLSPSPRSSAIDGTHPQSAPPIEVRAATAADDVSRDLLVGASSQGTFFHLSRWRDFVHGLYGHEPLEFAAWQGDELVGFLPLTLCRGLTGGRHLLSIPYSVYGGPVARTPEAERALLEEAKVLAERKMVRFLELRFEADPGLDWPGTDLYWTFKRDLPDRPEDVLAAMPKKSRAEARKARKKHGLELSEGKWYVDDLYRLFFLNKHTLGSPALSPEHFYRLADEMGEDVFVHLVRRDQEPLAAVMSFAHRDTLIAYYAGTAPHADRAYSASNFMYMALQEWAVTRGFKVFDFCRSRGESGAFKFKVHQGFEPTQLHYRYHLVNAKEKPSFNPSNPRTEVLRKTWSRLPLWVTRRLSKPLSRYLS